uniref:PAX3-and PAX7-binding protein 1 (Trinotate prediction) n=1 Tax=Henneguya salminicola TaxID=69463 RepID=A0A6G3MFP9_HENSL
MPDQMLILILYEEILCKKIIRFIEIWDCYSYSQTLNLRNIVSWMFNDNPIIDEHSSNFMLLFKNLYEKLLSAAHDIYMPIYPARLIENDESGAIIFILNQISLCNIFLKNCILWLNLIDTIKLKTLVVDILINKYIIVGLIQIPDVFLSLDFCTQVLFYLFLHRY